MFLVFTPKLSFFLLLLLVINCLHPLCQGLESCVPAPRLCVVGHTQDSPRILLLGHSAGCKLIVANLVPISSFFLWNLFLSAYLALASYYSHNYFALKMATN